MSTEPDDRLAGDLVWELFPAPTERPKDIRARLRQGVAAALLVVLTWFLWQPLAVVVACLAVSLKDFRRGRRLARTISDKAGGRVCSVFSHAWGAWKIGAAGFASGVVVVLVLGPFQKEASIPTAFTLAMVFWFLGFIASAAMAAVGLARAYRSGLRVWIGEGVNQARALFLGMLVVGFALVVIMPVFLLLAPFLTPRPANPHANPFLFLGILFSLMIGGSVVILVVLDHISRRVIAERPGKFGPKVPAVGKWNE
jgi:hypothetical protein